MAKWFFSLFDNHFITRVIATKWTLLINIKDCGPFHCLMSCPFSKNTMTILFVMQLPVTSGFFYPTSKTIWTFSLPNELSLTPNELSLTREIIKMKMTKKWGGALSHSKFGKFCGPYFFQPLENLFFMDL